MAADLSAPVTAVRRGAAAPPRVRFLWLDLTRRCQLACTHCYNASGPGGGHGAMTREDWLRLLGEAAAYGVREVQFIGGEPTLHPDFADLAGHALERGLRVEVFSNLVHVPAACWALFGRDGMSLATSYYSADPAEHDTVTARRSHRRTRGNIVRAVGLGIPLRVGVIGSGPAVESARRELAGLGVTRVGTDAVRPFGRAAAGAEPQVGALCGRCGDGRAAVGPDGDVSPCVFSTWLSAGNVRDTPLATLLAGPAFGGAVGAVRSAVGAVRSAAGQPDDCFPEAPWPCGPDAPGTCGPTDEECSPGTPGTICSPRS